MKWLEINRCDLIHNIKIIKEHCAPAKIIAVLKGNAYGLDAVQFGKILLENEIDTFAVSELSEALALRNAGFENKILLLTPPNNFDDSKQIIDNDITATVSNYENAELLNKIGLPVNVHIKIDTGFGRYGFLNNQLSDKLLNYKNINYEGIFSHFSNSFGKDDKYTKKQFDKFTEALEILKNIGISPKIRHISNSCAALRYDYAKLDAVRIGSAFLGRLPIENKIGLKKIADLKCSISEIRQLPKGSFVGYANTFVTKKDTKTAIITVGYKDGYGVQKSNDIFRFKDILRYIFNDLKSLNKGIYVTINNKKYPVIGRISMHNIVIDITGSDIKPDDIAVMECNPILLKSEIKRIYI
ncbi:MAG: alanine racemase [Clostridia bacterium]|nr:alanine racemase [Clostridia bacterium]